METLTRLFQALPLGALHLSSAVTWRCLNGTDACLRLHTACPARLLLEAGCSCQMPSISSSDPSSCPPPSPPPLPPLGTALFCSSWTWLQLRSALHDQLKLAKLSIISSLLSSACCCIYTQVIMALATLSKIFCTSTDNLCNKSATV